MTPCNPLHRRLGYRRLGYRRLGHHRLGHHRLGHQRLGRVAALLGLAMAVLGPAIVSAQTEIDRRVETRSGDQVAIENIAGSVTVIGWDEKVVAVTGVHGRGIDDVVVERRGGRIEIRVKTRHGSGHGGSAELDVRVPRESRVSVETVSADIRLEKIGGEVGAESVSGSVEIKGRPSSVEVETVSGNIEIEGAVGRIRAESVNGTLRIGGGRDIEAGSVSGSVRLAGLEDAANVEIESVSGRIELDGGLAKGADVSISSHNGSITIVLPESISARFDVSSFSGRIDNELGPPARRERFSPGRELSFTTGSGDARIHIESFAGSITLRRR